MIENDANECTNLFEMRADQTFTNFVLAPHLESRLDYYGLWLDQGETICFTQTGWARVDLAKVETVDTGKRGLSSFYCNEIVQSTADTMTVTLPTDDALLTIRRLDALPVWATK